MRTMEIRHSKLALIPLILWLLTTNGAKAFHLVSSSFPRSLGRRRERNTFKNENTKILGSEAPITELETSDTVPNSPEISTISSWQDAQELLHNPQCCVVTVSYLEDHLQALQSYLLEPSPSSFQNSESENESRVMGITQQPPLLTNIDMRARCRVSSSYADCQSILESFLTLKPPNKQGELSKSDDASNDSAVHSTVDPHVVQALNEIAMGMAHMAERHANGTGSTIKATATTTRPTTDVMIRIVSASNYQARDPPYHTDKCPVRGYVTLRGVGTEFLQRPINTPLEYLGLRTFSPDIDPNTQGESDHTQDIRQAQELEFIVMKGDYYYDHFDDINNNNKNRNWPFPRLLRATACVHRSPPGVAAQKRRVILSVDWADGSDDREWFDCNQPRSWRVGMTQRKSRLVA